MKKTLTVNLGGTVYHIDEDAYVLLDNYLNNLRYHFRKSEGAEEIVRDMEARIAELFDEYLHQGHQVVTIEEVEAVIARMGKPEELNDGTEEGEATAGQTAGPDPSEEVTGRPDPGRCSQWLGGLSGAGRYLDTYYSDPDRSVFPRHYFLVPDLLDCDAAGPYRYRETSDAGQTGKRGKHR